MAAYYDNSDWGGGATKGTCSGDDSDDVYAVLSAHAPAPLATELVADEDAITGVELDEDADAGPQASGAFTREEINDLPEHQFDSVGNVKQVYGSDGEPRHTTEQQHALARRLVATILAAPDFSPTVWQKLLE